MICFSAKSFLKFSGTSFLIPLHDSDVVYQKVFLVFMSLSIHNAIGEMKVDVENATYGESKKSLLAATSS